MIAYLGLLFTVVFESNDPNRDLPSFPTRRSSDLQEARRDHGRRHDVQRVRRVRAVDRVVCRAGLPARLAGPVEPEGGEDRKSTRLNSSHLVISYAVLCLKNKTKS